MAVRSKFLDRIDLGRIVDLIRFLLLLPTTKLLSQLICFHEKKTPEGEWKVNRIPAALHFCSAFLSREQQKKNGSLRIGLSKRVALPARSVTAVA